MSEDLFRASSTSTASGTDVYFTRRGMTLTLTRETAPSDPARGTLWGPKTRFGHGAAGATPPAGPAPLRARCRRRRQRRGRGFGRVELPTDRRSRQRMASNGGDCRSHTYRPSGEAAAYRGIERGTLGQRAQRKARKLNPFQMRSRPRGEPNPQRAGGIEPVRPPTRWKGVS